MTDFDLWSPTRETVTVFIPPQQYDVTITIEDGQRVSVTFGNTTRAYDAITNRPAGMTIVGPDSPTEAPNGLRIGRLDAAALADIRDKVNKVCSPPPT